MITRFVKSTINSIVDAALAKRLGDVDNLINERIARGDGIQVWRNPRLISASMS